MTNEIEDSIDEKIDVEIAKCMNIISKRKLALSLSNELGLELQIEINKKELESFEQYKKILEYQRIKHWNKSQCLVHMFDKIIPPEVLERYKQMLEVSAFTSYYICKCNSLYCLAGIIENESSYAYFNLDIAWECENPTNIWLKTCHVREDQK